MRALLVALAVGCAACDAVPEVTYLDDAAPPDAAVTDAAETDATNDGPDGCPDNMPSNATSCCGPVACSGANCSATCPDCMARCSVDKLCCPNPQNHAVCSSSGSCP